MTERRTGHWKAAAAKAAIAAALACLAAIAQGEDEAAAKDETGTEQSGEKSAFAGLKARIGEELEAEIEANLKAREARRKAQAEGGEMKKKKKKGSKDRTMSAKTPEFTKTFDEIFKEELKLSAKRHKAPEGSAEAADTSKIVDEALKSTWGRMKDAAGAMDGLTPEMPAGPDKELLCLGTADPMCE